MSSGDIDRIPVSQLIERYKLARSAVYSRMNALDIEPERVGNKAYINAAQLRLMDDLHYFIQSGGQTAEFQESRGIKKKSEPDGSRGQFGGSLIPNDFVQMFASIASRFQPPADPLAYYDKLEQAARNGWLMRTSEIAELLGLSLAEMKYYGDSFSEAGFIFSKAGYRAGGEVAWRVSKSVK